METPFWSKNWKMKLQKYLVESINMNWVERSFREWTKKIWGENAYERIDDVLSFQQKNPKEDVLMSVVWGMPGPRAIGTTLVRTAKYYNVLVSDRMIKDTDKEKALKIIKHEVIHLGYGKHDRKFRKLVKEFGAAYSEHHSEDGGFELQIQIKPRKYKTIQMFEDPDEAQEYARIVLNSPNEVEKLKKKYKVKTERLKLRIRG